MNLQQIKNIFFTGNNFFSQGLFPLAEKKYLEVLQFIPDHRSSIFNLLTIYLENNLEVEKIKNLKKFKYKDYFFSSIIIESLSLNLLKNSIKYIENYFKTNPIDFENDEQLLILFYLNILYQKNNNFFKSFLIIKKFIKYNKKNLVLINFIAQYFSLIGKFEKTKYYYELLYSLQKSNKVVQKNLGYTYLRFKDFKQGFKLIDNRNVAVDDDRFNLIERLYDCKGIKNKKILIFNEAGLGDNIHFFKFVITLIEKLDSSNEFFFYCNKKLKKLFLNLDFKHKNFIKFISPDEKFNFHFDYQTSIMSIPNLLDLTNREILSYREFSLTEDKKISNKIDSSKINIGLCFSGNKFFKYDHLRSMEYETFKKMINVKVNHHYFYLQQISDIKHLDLDERYFTYLGNVELDELPFFLKNLNFVITTDTSIVHLCGILNVDTYLLLSKSSEWRWFNDSSVSSWYPSVKIIKQKKLNDWSFCIKAIKENIL